MHFLRRPSRSRPDLIGWVPDGRSVCYWKKQPETPAELNQAFAIFQNQELGCHRYAGHDPAILDRLGYDDCDYPSPRQKVLATRDISFLPFETPSLFRRFVNASRRWQDRSC